MGLIRLLASKRFARLTGVSMLVRAGRRLLRGDKRTAALLVGAGALAFRSTWAGVLAELGIRAYRRHVRPDEGSAEPAAGPR
jgi:hypothetical protein